jgi:hypothetical protein
MKLFGHDEDQVDVRLSLDELVLVNRALRELCFGFHLSDPDFHAILGVPRYEAEALLRRTQTALQRLRLDVEVQ